MLHRDRMFSPRAVAAHKGGPTARGLSVKAATEEHPCELLIYDVIGESWDGSGVSDVSVLAALANAGDVDVTVRINSPGGDLWAGLAIYNALTAHKGKVTTVVDGVAASAASFIAMAGAVREMRQASMMMVHQARSLSYGTADDMTKTGALLAKVDGQLTAIYAARCGITAEAVAEMLAAETWFTADEAKAAGFCDSVTTPTEAPAAPQNRAGVQRAFNILRLMDLS